MILSELNGFVFRKYNEIENTYREKVIQQTIEQGLSEGKWVVTEKIHGSNLTFYTNGKDIQAAKRNSFLSEEEEDKFYNCKEIKQKYRESILRTFEIIKKYNVTTNTVRIHGEIFGGIYPHKEVKPNPKAVKVQDGVFYCPQNEFYVFDIHDGIRYIDYLKLVEICKETKLLFAEPLFIGEFKDALQYPCDFRTLLPERFNLPPIEKNEAEGIVIKPNVSMWYNNGSRVAFKKKTEKFREKSIIKSPKKRRKI